MSVWRFRVLLALSVPAWVATASLSSVTYMVLTIRRHVVDGSSYCWEPPTFASTTSCRGKDHSLLQGRLRYGETWGVPKPEVCAALLRGAPPIVCHRDVPFRLVPCPPPFAEGWHCFGCEYAAATADRYRTWHFLRGDCAEAVAWTSVNVDEVSMVERLAGLGERGR